MKELTLKLRDEFDKSIMILSKMYLTKRKSEFESEWVTELTDSLVEIHRIGNVMPANAFITTWHNIYTEYDYTRLLEIHNSLLTDIPIGKLRDVDSWVSENFNDMLKEFYSTMTLFSILCKEINSEYTRKVLSQVTF